MATPTTRKPRAKATKPAADQADAATSPATPSTDSPIAGSETALAAKAPRNRATPKATSPGATTATTTAARENVAVAKPTPARKPAAPRSTGTTPQRRAVSRPAPSKPVSKPQSAPAKSGSILGAVGPRAAWSIGALLVAAGAGLAAFLTRGRINELLAGPPSEGHVPTDLLDPKRNADDRAVADFRPNIDAPMTDAEREALRPAPGTPAKVVVSR